MQEVRDTIRRLFSEKKIDRAMGWIVGESAYDQSPALFADEQSLDKFVYDDFSGANLSKYMVKESDKDGKVLVCLKPCDTYSFNQLQKEHRIHRDNIFVLGVPCDGKIDIEKIRARGITGITDVKVEGENVLVETVYGAQTCPKSEVLLDKCVDCKGKKHMVYDELIGQEGELNTPARFDMVEKLEAMTPDERFAFWQGELSRCIRCNACRNVCPACTCEKCVFDNDNSGVAAKSNANSFEEKMFHIIRAFHVAGRCTDCGECSRVCPQHIPLHLLNRKFIKDIDTFYGEYQAGEDLETKPPLVSFMQDDVEPSIIKEENK